MRTCALLMAPKNLFIYLFILYQKCLSTPAKAVPWFSFLEGPSGPGIKRRRQCLSIKHILEETVKGVHITHIFFL